MIDLQNTTDMSTHTQMVSLESNAQSVFWTIQDITESQSLIQGTTNFELSSSGSPYIMYHQADLKLKTYTGFTPVESEIVLTANDVMYLSSINGLSGEQYLAYYSPGLNTIYLNELTEQGWNEQVVATNANVS